MRGIITILTCFVCVHLVAQVQFSADTITLQTTQIPQKLSETGRSISIITSEEIASLSATSIDEVLQTVVGVEIQSRGGFGVQGDIQMRGSTFTQVLILIDGMKMNDPLTGHFNSYIPVTMSEIERIEVLRGAASAMYGADAVGGVINIITKTFAQSASDATHAEINYGEHNLVAGQIGAFRNRGKLRLSGGIQVTQSDGEFINEVVIDTNTTLEAYYNFFDINTVGASASYGLMDQVRLSVQTSFDHRDVGARYWYTASAFDKSVETIANWWNRVQVAIVSDKSSTDINLAHKQNTDEFVFSPDFPSTNNHVSQYTNLTVNHLRPISDHLTLKGGIQVDRRAIESNDRGDHNDMHYGGYAMGAYQQNQWNVIASLRGDYDDNYQFEFSPSVNVSYVMPQLVLRGSVGKSIRAADYTERFVSNNLTNLSPGRNLGNPDLLAERSWSQEIGVDYTPIEPWRLSVTGFSRQSSNLIDFVSANEGEIGSVSEIGSLQAGADYFFAQNIFDVVTSGVEVESNYTRTLGDNMTFSWTLGYTLMNTTNEEDIISVYISSHAKHLVANRVVLRGKNLSIGVNSLYKQREARVASSINSELEESYWLWNTRIGYDLTDGAGIHLDVRNVFDKAYQNILGAQMPGRWLMGGVHWGF